MVLVVGGRCTVAASCTVAAVVGKMGLGGKETLGTSDSSLPGMFVGTGGRTVVGPGSAGPCTVVGGTVVGSLGTG